MKKFSVLKFLKENKRVILNWLQSRYEKNDDKVLDALVEIDSTTTINQIDFLIDITNNLQADNISTLNEKQLCEFVSLFTFFSGLNNDNLRKDSLRKNNTLFELNYIYLKEDFNKYLEWTAPTIALVERIIKYKRNEVNINEINIIEISSGFELLNEAEILTSRLKDKIFIKTLNENEAEFPIIKRDFDCLESSCISIAQVERSFSLLKNILTQLRTKLTDKHIENLTFIYFNKHS